MSTVAVPLQVQAAASQVAFTTSGPVLSLGLTIQIPINELIEALLAYQEHYQRAAPGGLQKEQAGAGAGGGAPGLAEPKAIPPTREVSGQPAAQPPHAAPSSNAPSAQPPQSQSPQEAAAGGGDEFGAPGLPQRQPPPPQQFQATWETDFAQLHRKGGDEYLKKSKWNPEKGYVPPGYKKGDQNPLQIKEFTITADGAKDGVGNSQDGNSTTPGFAGDAPEEGGTATVYPPGLSPHDTAPPTSDQSDTLAARNSLGSALTDGDDKNEDGQEKDCKQQ